MHSTPWPARRLRHARRGSAALLLGALLVWAGILPVRPPAHADAASTSFNPTSVTLAANGSAATITVTSVGVDDGVQGAQINIQHPSNVSITSPTCVGLFAGATPLGPSQASGGTVVGCLMVSGAARGQTGDIMTFVVTRLGPGDSALTFGTGGQFATQFSRSADTKRPGALNTLQVLGSGVAAQVQPTWTPAPTSAAVVPTDTPIPPAAPVPPTPITPPIPPVSFLPMVTPIVVRTATSLPAPPFVSGVPPLPVTNLPVSNPAPLVPTVSNPNPAPIPAPPPVPAAGAAPPPPPPGGASAHNSSANSSASGPPAPPALPAGAPPETPAEAVVPDGWATTSGIVDGGTVDVVLESGMPARVRYSAIEVPRLGSGDAPGECFSAEAAQRNRELIGDQPLWLESDAALTDADGNLLRYIWIGEVQVNAQLVAEGYARVAAASPDTRYAERLRQLEAAARENALGLWSACG